MSAAGRPPAIIRMLDPAVAHPYPARRRWTENIHLVLILPPGHSSFGRMRFGLVIGLPVITSGLMCSLLAWSMTIPSHFCGRRRKPGGGRT